MKGKYIIIEGNDGTGKSTQVDLLAEYLRGEGQKVMIVEEPGSDDPEKSTPVADRLRDLIKDARLERSPEINVGLFSAARRELWQNKIHPALQRGETVISARNYLSTLAYQGGGEGIDEECIVEMTRLFTDDLYINPDLVVVLTLDNETRLDRIKNRGSDQRTDTFESRPDDFQNKVNSAYVKIAKKHNIPTIDASASIKSVHEEIRKHIDNHIF